MKHSGKAAQAALKLIFWTLVLLLALLAAGVVARHFATLIAWAASALVGLWVLFAAFTFYFFRDPEPVMPADPKAIVSPAHGTVDVIEEATEAEVMGGPCRRISIFLSVIDVHVQRAPVSGNVTHYKHKLGQFLSATKAHCAEFNENVLLGFECPAQGGAKVSAFAQQQSSFQLHGFLSGRAIYVKSQPSWTEHGFGRFDVGAKLRPLQRRVEPSTLYARPHIRSKQ